MTVETNSLFRIDSIHLENFQCFESTSLALHPSLTVLVADNAQGKTSFLLGLAQAIDAYASVVKGVTPSGLNRNDIRRVFTGNQRLSPCLPAKYQAHGILNGDPVEWGLTLETINKRGRSKRANAKTFTRLAKRFVTKALDHDDTLPVIAYYGTGRLHREHRKSDKKADIKGRPSAFVDCTSSSSSYAVFAEWYASMVRQLKDPVYRIAQSGEDFRPELALSAVREAIRLVLKPTEWNEIDWQSDEEESSIQTDEGTDYKGYIVVENSEYGRFPLPYLSDGVRSMVTMVGDLAHRCVRLNPHLSENAASETPGVVLIDEVDMHLHPSWQQMVIKLLQDAFPKIQFVLTTHSPHVLSTVDVESIRTIQFVDGHPDVRTPAFQTKGVESADVLSSIMGVSPIPRVEEACWLDEYKILIQESKLETPRAQELKSMLMEHFGEMHPVMQDCEKLIRFQNFRLRREKGGSDA